MRIRSVFAAGALALALPVAASAATLIRTGDLDNHTEADIWKITVGSDGGSFKATTAGTVNDTQLFLFDGTWMGLYSNDDDPALGYQSTIATPLAAGLYYVMVSYFDVDPMSNAGLIFPNDRSSYQAQVGPSGAGGGSPFNQTYSGPPVGFPYNGPYTLTLDGVETADLVPSPEPATLALFGTGALGLARRAWRRKK